MENGLTMMKPVKSQQIPWWTDTRSMIRDIGLKPMIILLTLRWVKNIKLLI